MNLDMAYHIYDETPSWLRVFIPVMSQKQTYDIVTDDDTSLEEKITAMTIGTFISGTHFALGAGAASDLFVNLFTVKKAQFLVERVVPNLGRIIPMYALVVTQIAAGEHIASGGAKGHNLYTDAQRRRVQETGFSGMNLHYRSV
jgi:hypothetical protein